MREEYTKDALGNFPGSWDIVSVGEITEEHKQGYYTKDSYSKGGIKLVRITDLKNPKVDFSGMPFLQISDKDFSDFKVELGDFLFARSGAIGRYGIVEQIEHPAIFASYLIKFKFNRQKVVPRFFGYFFESGLCKIQLKAISQGNANVNINAENIKSLKLPLPNLIEQQKIVSILCTVDEKISVIEEQINETETLKKGLMQQLLTKGIGHTKFKDSPLGDIPESWEVVKLKELINVKHGHAFQGEGFTKMKNENLLLTPVNFKLDGGIKFEWSKQKYYTKDFPKEYILRQGDLIVALTDLTQSCDILGAPAIIPDNNFSYLHNQRLGLVTVKNMDVILKEYLFHFFNTEHYRAFLKATKTGTTVSHTSPKTIYDVDIGVPPIVEQNKIYRILNMVDDKLETLQAKKQNFLELKRGLMQQLLTGKMRVKLN